MTERFTGCSLDSRFRQYPPPPPPPTHTHTLSLACSLARSLALLLFISPRDGGVSVYKTKKQKNEARCVIGLHMLKITRRRNNAAMKVCASILLFSVVAGFPGGNTTQITNV